MQAACSSIKFYGSTKFWSAVEKIFHATASEGIPLIDGKLVRGGRWSVDGMGNDSNVSGSKVRLIVLEIKGGSQGGKDTISTGVVIQH